MDNIIDFKSIKAKKEQDKFDAIIEEKIDDEKLFAHLGMHVALDVMQVFDEFDFDLYRDPKVIRDILLLVESVRAIGNRLSGELYHTHSVSDALFGNITNPEEVLEEFLSDLYEE